MTVETQADKVLDTRGQFCPGPVLAARKAVDELAEGQVLAVLATDPAAESDLQAWAKWAGHTVLAVDKSEGYLRVLLRKGG
ncbi:MAG: sulfurtransferase TusA family protein [Dehalococcoidia bacterium]|jgi:TusA-related sulfurtransferase|nr:sulfurtransferase TusA family protein [Dehalococcoidia bacterium]MDW8009534.1 sulfurtransferase TusA family protein [Chloroflexota bacterium]